MKKVFHLFLIIGFVLTLTNCRSQSEDKNKSITCSQTDWVGNYTGDCMDFELTLKVEASITQRLDVSIEVPDGSHFTNGLFDGCYYTYSLEDIQVLATLDGNVITYRDARIPCKSIIFTRD